MRLLQREQDKLMLHAAGMLAQRRLARLFSIDQEALNRITQVGF